MDPAKVGIYIRVSTQAQVDKGYSLSAQEKLGVELCERKGFSYEIFREEGASANKETLENRPVLKYLLDNIEIGKYQYIFVVEMDRLSRNPITLYYIKKILSDNNCKVLTLNQTYDFTDMDDDFITDLLGSLAKRENKQRVVRSLRGKIEAAKQGRWMGGIHPFGYDVVRSGNKSDKAKLIINQKEAEIYKQMGNWYLEGMGVRRIVYKLRELGIGTKQLNVYGKKTNWSESSVAGILYNKLYTGIYSFKGVRGKIPAIIDNKTYYKIIEKKDKNKTFPDRPQKHNYMLQGLVYCGQCGNKWYSKYRDNGKYNYYICKTRGITSKKYYSGTCDVPQIQMKVLDKYIWKEIHDLVTDKNAIADLIKKSTKDNKISTVHENKKIYKNRIAEINLQIDKLLELYSKAKTISMDETEEKISQLQKQKQLYESKLMSFENQGTKTDKNYNIKSISFAFEKIKRKLKNITYLDKCKIVKQLINKVDILYIPKTKKYKFNVKFNLPI